MIDWFTQADADGDVVRISEPHANDLLSANFWWLRGNDRDVVVDAGLGVVALRQAIPAMFERDPMVLLTPPRRGSWRRGYRRACTARSSTTNSGSTQRENLSRTS